MDKRTINLFNLAYDNLYNLNSKLHYRFNRALEELEKEVLKQGYKFKLNDKTQKFKLKRVENE